MPTGATHPYVSKPNDPTLHLALWHGHVVAGHGGPVPLALRKSTWKHRGVIPPVCMHHGGGAAHPHYLWCVSFPFTLVIKSLFSPTCALHAGYPTHKAHKPCNRLWSCGELAGQHPGGTSRTAGKTTLLTLRRRKIGRAQKVRRKDAQDSQGQDLG